jgi:hypothetical protein
MLMICACIHFDLGMDLLLLRDGMFALVLKVEGFVYKDSSGRKAYTKAECLSGMWSMGH